MVRKIEFKAQVSHYDTRVNPDDGWVKGYFFKSFSCSNGKDGNSCCSFKSCITSGEMEWEVKRGTVCQFTGLFDKKGVEIYEGDIVIFENADGNKFQGIVKYVTCSFIVWSKATPFFYDFKPNSNKLDGSVEVIGNIYDMKK